MKLLTTLYIGVFFAVSHPIYKSADFTETVIHTDDNKIINVGDSIVLGTPEDVLNTKYSYVTDSLGNPHPYDSSKFFSNTKFGIVGIRKDEAIKVVDSKGKEWFFIWNKANLSGEVFLLQKTTSNTF